MGTTMDCITDAGRELEDLAVEVFATTYCCDWRQAWLTAWAELAPLLDYAREWDTDASDAAAIVSTAWAAGCLK